MTTREISDRVGGWEERPDEIFWVEDGAYIEAIKGIGYRATVLADLKFHHTGGPYYTQPIPEKTELLAPLPRAPGAPRRRQARARAGPRRAAAERALRLVRGAVLSSLVEAARAIVRHALGARW